VALLTGKRPNELDIGARKFRRTVVVHESTNLVFAPHQ
jgi:hypothetical protein